MKYYVSINKRYQYVKVYNIVKRLHENTNRISKFAASFIEGLLLKQKKEV